MTDTVILLEEKWTESAARDLFSLLIAALMTVPGWALDMRAISFIGVCLFFIIILSRALGLRKKYTMTLDEAKAVIDGKIAAREE